MTTERVRLPHERAKPLLLGVGVALLVVVSLVMYLRRVDTVEVLATLFFVPIFAALLFWGWRAGVAVAVLAAAGYAWLRFPAIEAVGFVRFLGVLLGRTAAYLAFGAIGGWASQHLTTSIEKLDEVDPVDDATGLFNAREFVRAIQLEKARSQRYGKEFSVAVADFPAGPIDALGRRERETLLKALGSRIRESIRSVDRASFGRHDDRFALAVVLPETGAEGAQTFLENLRLTLVEVLEQSQAAGGAATIGATTATFPTETDAMNAVTDHYRELAKQAFPESAETG